MAATGPYPEPEESSPYLNVNVFGITFFHIVLSLQHSFSIKIIAINCSQCSEKSHIAYDGNKILKQSLHLCLLKVLNFDR
jgi:hypothetical protein